MIRIRKAVLLTCVALALPLICLRAQNPSAPPQSQTTTEANQAEMTTHDSAATFKVNVRLVEVRVVVRDNKDHTVGNLKKEDFQLFDNHKPQTITHFAMEQPGSQIMREVDATTEPGEAPPAKAPNVPERFVAYLFDDTHLEAKYLLPARAAADRYLATLAPTDRAAIYTTSGQGGIEFTDDHAQLQDALLHVQPRQLALTNDLSQCPMMSYYMADLIVNKGDDEATNVAAADALACNFNNSSMYSGAAIALAQSAARHTLQVGDAETRLVLARLKEVVRRMVAAPGQRVIVLVTPGFITPDLQYEVQEIIDKAVHANVIVSALDARGLYTIDPLGDITRGPAPTEIQAQEQLYVEDSEHENQMVLMTLTDSTGGVLFHNSNDLEGGFRLVGTPPEYSYVLGFSPQNLKLDGHYHDLKVSLVSGKGLTVQARKGYYAPRPITDPVEAEKHDLEDAVFSQEKMGDIPVELHTQFFKSAENSAKLTVLAHVDIHSVHFRKADDRNCNELTVISAIFNRNGDYIQGTKKVLTMRLRDETLQRRMAPGINIRTSFDVKPGSYLVRLVVRDKEDKMMSAETGAIEIP